MNLHCKCLIKFLDDFSYILELFSSLLKYIIGRNLDISNFYCLFNPIWANMPNRCCQNSVKLGKYLKLENFILIFLIKFYLFKLLFIIFNG